ncbi:MAG TPA: hypothetical protein EYH57_08870 [Sulfurovum sp.]|nr:hypothetical protein [Sulfurovum sp.]
MNKKITLSLATAFTLPAMSATNAELEAMLMKLQKDFGNYKVAQEKKITSLEKQLSTSQKNQKTTQKTTTQTVVKQKETAATGVAILKKQTEKYKNSGESVAVTESNPDPSFMDMATDTVTTDTYESFTDLGLAASKVYNTDTALSIGGYGEYKYKKYTNFKNYASETANETRRKSETNVVRFIPYIGYKFNDWIVMNTEIEFEDGGARSDGTKNYKYAIVEFSYLDFLLDEKYSFRVGHILVPFGNINLNHEPVAFLTSERPLVETFIIPSTWSTNGALAFGSYEGFDYYTGIITSPDAGKFREGRFIQMGRQGARQFTDDFSGVARLSYKGFTGMELGGSLFYGQSSTLAESKPGVPSSGLDLDVSMFMAEAHMRYKYNGWNVQGMAVMGSLGDDYDQLSEYGTIAGSVNGQYLTVGYDVLHTMNTNQQLFAVGEVERLDMDADGETANPDNYKFNEYTLGLAYFPDPKVVIKAEYNMKDYADGSQLADEEAFVASLGFIF